MPWRCSSSWTALSLGVNPNLDVISLAGLTQLNWLYLRGCNLTDVRALAKLNKLEELHLSHNKIADISALAECKQLKRLWLYGNNLTKAKIAKLQNELPNCMIFHDTQK